MRNKILMILPIVLCTFGIANAQNNDASSVKQTEVIVNGKPYSQHKAEQDALKQQQEAKKLAGTKVVFSGPGVNNNSPVDAVNPADKIQPVKEPITQKPVPTYTITQQPEVPEQFKLPATTPTWNGTAVADKQVVNRSAPTSVELKSNPAQPIDGSIPVEASKTKQTVEKVEFRQGAGTTTPQDVKPVTQKANATTPVAPPVIKAETEKNPSGNNSTGAQTKTD